MHTALDEDDFNSAAEVFVSISGYKDSDILANECRKNAENIRSDKERERKENIYKAAEDQYIKQTSESVLRAADLFSTIQDFRDAKTRVNDCLRLAEKLKESERLAREEMEKKNLLLEENKRNESIYKSAEEFYREETAASVFHAAELFSSIRGFNDAEIRACKCFELAEKLKEAEIRAREEAERNRILAEKKTKHENRRKELLSELESIEQKKEVAQSIIGSLKGTHTNKRVKELQKAIAKLDYQKKEVQRRLDMLKKDHE